MIVILIEIAPCSKVCQNNKMYYVIFANKHSQISTREIAFPNLCLPLRVPPLVVL